MYGALSTFERHVATYPDIQDYVRRKCGRTVKTCWIAHVKELNGLEVRRAPNRFQGEGRSNPCPDWARPLIEEALRHFKTL